MGCFQGKFVSFSINDIQLIDFLYKYSIYDYDIL